jgi:hypothetical protein
MFATESILILKKTMKTLTKNLFLLLVISSCLSCSNDDDPAPVIPTPTVYTEQNPFAAYLVAAGFTVVNPITTVQDTEFGLSFKPLVNGKITAIVAKFPVANPYMRITFWNKSGSGSVIRTNYINVSTAGEEITTFITPLNLVANTEYMISFNSSDWYDHRKPPGTSTDYPYTIEDITITGFGIKAGTEQSIPNSFTNIFYKGDVSFKFLRTE